MDSCGEEIVCLMRVTLTNHEYVDVMASSTVQDDFNLVNEVSLTLVPEG